jgi:hypothetical protein
MSSQPFTPKAYLREGCPFSFKFLTFLSEAGLLDEFEVVRLNPRGPNFEAEKAKLSKGLGKAATFPVVEIEPGRYMADSDRLIERYAERAGLKPDSMPVLSFYKETIFPQLIELFQIKHPKTSQSM